MSNVINFLDYKNKKTNKENDKMTDFLNKFALDDYLSPSEIKFAMSFMDNTSVGVDDIIENTIIEIDFKEGVHLATRPDWLYD